MTNRKQVLMGLLIAAVSGFSACGPKIAQSPRVPYGAVNQDRAGRHVDTNTRFFPAADITFKETQLFLWKSGFSEADVAEVLRNSSKLDETKDRIFLLSQRERELSGQFEAAGVSVGDYLGQLQELTGKQEALEAAQKQLAALQAAPPSGENTQEISKLNRKITKLTSQIEELKPQVEAAKAAVAAAHLEATIPEWEQLEKDLTAERDLATEYLQPINNRVWLYQSSPIHFSFKFGAPGEVHAEVHNWDLGKIEDSEASEPGLPTDFSSEGTSADAVWIDQVAYDEDGGLFTLVVHTPKAVFWLKLARIQYGAIDRRVHYKGDIIRCSVADGDGAPVIRRIRDTIQCGVDGAGSAVLRRGAANLVDRDDKS